MWIFDGYSNGLMFSNIFTETIGYVHPNLPGKSCRIPMAIQIRQIGRIWKNDAPVRNALARF